ncbi:hypothetical protein H112_06578 [Trichophyton rubrum D6]|uniref:Glutathione S-transferase kappa n=4 Tax=Trichophyton TaxID=5550 RepID=A0A178F173_TRIRU|nr:hypothetical protein H100_06595 [Trichophyton rubrum MR850]EZF39224.1 hypothetical protein H102_06562 [Trichophyton rubrum CBS 100081]EZF49871.1 hypothetical protein H103_06587 [Trichophyton rubrum CBS 288.86]EZF60507.1 hypothetical protein H104_06542 [Trichophyton rubrum CBS 289.86]EZF71192.1 hypothetical protein H105_06599 [Trichophyton soudanense CBS 452.61]EZF81921.1 hypothetical protein H110_06582 [Trichophyton rubrum MR1448]EZG14087.1 hypothetical protein H107_06732 [Trichophyton rub
MGGKIEAYLDCPSPYSYYAFLHLLRNRDVLESHGVEIDVHPVFLGGINAGSGNKPPWTLPAKAAYGQFDRVRAGKYFGVDDFKVPSFFPPLTILPQRCATYIKQNYPRERFENTFLLYWKYMFYKNIDLSKPEGMTELLEEANFSKGEIDRILTSAKTDEIKKALADRTQEALDRGAFGAPWFWVRHAETGREEPFFGSDRFHFMWGFLGIPFDDVKIRPAEKAKI